MLFQEVPGEVNTTDNHVPHRNRDLAFPQLALELEIQKRLAYMLFVYDQLYKMDSIVIIPFFRKVTNFKESRKYIF